MSLTNRPPAAPIGKVKRQTGAPKRRRKRKATAARTRTRKMSAKQAKYFGKRRGKKARRK